MKLEQSQTYLNYVDASGMCTHCYEHTDVLHPCCNASVEYEGGTIHPDDLISDIAYDLGATEQEVIDLL